MAFERLKKKVEDIEFYRQSENFSLMNFLGYDKYYEGYETRAVLGEDGKTHYVREYRGRWYVRTSHPVLSKVLYSILTLLALSSFILSDLLFPPVNTLLVIIPKTLHTVFLLYYLYAFLHFLFHEKKMKIYEYNLSSRSLIRASAVSGVTSLAVSLTLLASSSLLPSLLMLPSFLSMALLFTLEKNAVYDVIENEE